MFGLREEGMYPVKEESHPDLTPETKDEGVSFQSPLSLSTRAEVCKVRRRCEETLEKRDVSNACPSIGSFSNATTTATRTSNKQYVC